MKKIHFVQTLVQTLMVIVLLFSIWQCTKEDAMKVEKARLGSVDARTGRESLNEIFKSDSLGKIRPSSGLETQETLSVYDRKTGKEKLRFIFRKQRDSTYLYAVEITDPQYQTRKGLSVDSPYEQWKKNYKISRVETTLRHVVGVFARTLMLLCYIPYDALGRKTPNINPDRQAQIASALQTGSQDRAKTRISGYSNHRWTNRIKSFLFIRTGLSGSNFLDNRT